MSLTLHRIGERIWFIATEKGMVAEIYLDYHNQVDEVVLYADAIDDDRLSVLQLALWHGNAFVRDRTTSAMGGLLCVNRRNPDLSPSDSYRLMSFKLVPDEIRALNKDLIAQHLRDLGVEVVTVKYLTALAATEQAVREVGVPSLRFKVIPQQLSFRNEHVLEFEVNGPQRFMFWKWLETPADEGYHLVPPYHPVMTDGEPVGGVNGATDAYLGNKAIHSIYCPKAAQHDRRARNFGSSWNHLNHPFCATGRSFRLAISSTKVRSQEGIEELIKVLQGALNMGSTYIRINQGFRPPLKRACNRLNELGRSDEAERLRQNSSRGSEPSCVWEYRTLEREGVLAQAHVPSWVVDEGWLETYRTADVGPTMY